jgi:hypothetical protein
MEMWEENLLKKVNFVDKNKDKLAEEDRKTVRKIKTMLERGIAPPWKLHKQFTAIRVSLEDRLGGRKEQKNTGLNYNIIK